MTLEFTNVEMWGVVPDFISLDDPRGAVEQIHESYWHGGGWRDVSNRLLEVRDPGPGRAVLRIGDEEFAELARGRFRDEKLYLFDYSWVAVWGATLRVARID